MKISFELPAEVRSRLEEHRNSLRKLSGITKKSSNYEEDLEAKIPALRREIAELEEGLDPASEKEASNLATKREQLGAYERRLAKEYGPVQRGGKATAISVAEVGRELNLGKTGVDAAARVAFAAFCAPVAKVIRPYVKDEAQAMAYAGQLPASGQFAIKFFTPTLTVDGASSALGHAKHRLETIELLLSGEVEFTFQPVG